MSSINDRIAQLAAFFSAKLQSYHLTHVHPLYPVQNSFNAFKYVFRHPDPQIVEQPSIQFINDLRGLIAYQNINSPTSPSIPLAKNLIFSIQLKLAGVTETAQGLFSSIVDKLPEDYFSPVPEIRLQAFWQITQAGVILPILSNPIYGGVDRTVLVLFAIGKNAAPLEERIIETLSRQFNPSVTPPPAYVTQLDTTFRAGNRQSNEPPPAYTTQPPGRPASAQTIANVPPPAYRPSSDRGFH